MSETIGNRISKFRKAKGLTQEELASQLGVSSQAVSKWENDASCPDISLIPQLVKVLGVTADELLTGKNDTVQMLPKEQRKSLDELTMRVLVQSSDGTKVKVNLPMRLVKVALELGIEIAPGFMGEKGEALKGIDIAKITEMVEQGLIGKLVEMESASGDTVEVIVE